MKRTRNLVVILLFIVGIFVGVNALDRLSDQFPITDLSEQEAMVKAPKDALNQASKALDEALKQQDAPAVLAALIKQNTAQVLIDRDSLPSLIERTTVIADRATDPVEQSMIRLYIVDLYLQFMENNYQIAHRAEINDFTLPIASWSQNMFNERIDTLLSQALTPAEALQATPVSRYAQALELGNDTIFRPTLYDFVIAQSIELYQGINNILPLVEARMKLLPVEAFMTAPKSDNRILQLYAKALKAHAHNELSAPFMMWDLQRIKYLSRGISYYENKNHFYTYIDGLKTMLDRYQSLPYSVEIANFIVSQLQQSESYDDAKQALDLCEQWIARYPDYDRIALLKNQKADLTHKELSVNIPTPLYPGKSQTVMATYRNIKQYTLNIYRQPDTTSLYIQSLYRLHKGEWSRNHRIASISSTPSDGELSLISQNDTLVIPPLEPGFYAAELVMDGKSKGDAIGLSVSRVKSIVRNAAKGKLEMLVVDIQSGKPLPQATINLYTPTYHSGASTPQSSYKVNKMGLCTFTIGEKSRCVAQATIPGDKFSTPINLFYPYVQPAQEGEEPQTSLFIDRSIYRPGHTLYFSGIHYINTLESSRVVPNKKITIELLDASRKSISSVEKTTDEYGQFNGSFIIPQGGMLGNYRLVVNNQFGTSVDFSVEEYKLPIFKVEFDPVKEGGSFGKQLTVTGSATSYTGIPQAGATVSYTIERQTNPYRWFYVQPQQIAAGSTTVDASGHFAIAFTPQRETDASLLNKEQAYNYIIRATITAPTGETVEQSTSVAIGDSPYFVSVTAPLMIDKYQSAGKIKSEVRTLNGELVKRERRLIFYTLYDNDQADDLSQLKIKMQVGEVTIPAEGTAIYPDFTQWASGAYRIVAFSTDENGRTIQGECNFILYSNYDKKPARYTPLWLPRTEWEVEEGEKVEIPVGTSYQKGYLFYSIYSTEKLLETKMLKLNNACKTIPILFDSRFKGVATINFLIVKDGEMSTATATIRPQEPKRNLTITTSSFRDKLLPGTTEQWSFTVTDPEGHPVVARFMAEMFDASMQAVRPHDWHFKPTKPRLGYSISTYPTSRSILHRNLFVDNQQSHINYPPEQQTAFIYSKEFRYYHQPISLSYATYTKSSRTGSLSGVETTEEAVAEREVMSAKNMDSADVAAQGMPESDNEQGLSPDEYRSGEVSTAFFYPTLVTDSLGETTLSFTVPNENATWQFFALAYTQNLLAGEYEAQTISSKPIMVSPNLPRFVRQADEVSIATAVQNRTEEAQEGKVLFELFDPYTEAVLHTADAPFFIEAGESQTLSYRFTAPSGTALIGFRVKASTAQHSDGEQQVIPVLPSKVFVTDSQPFFIPSNSDTTVVTLPGVEKKLASNSVESYRMTLQYCNNPAWYAVQALPSLTEPTGSDAITIMATLFANSVASQLATDNPRIVQAIKIWKAAGGKSLTSPLTQNEELKQVLLSATPWVLQATNESEQIQQLASLLDKNRADRLAQDALRKLRDLQDASGGLCWFNGMRPGFIISLNALDYFSRMEELGVSLNEEIKMMQTQLVQFIDREMIERWNRAERQSTPYTLSYSDITYLYVRSAYRDIPLTGEMLTIHKQLMAQLKSWINFNDYEKAHAALALHRYGFTQEAKEIINSLRQYAITTPEKGMFWPNSRSSYFYRHGAVQKECAIFKAFVEIDPITAELDAMRQWLLVQKQTNQWASVPSTLDAISILLRQGTNWLAADTTPSSISWGGKPLDVNPDDAFTGISEYTLNSSEVTVDHAQAVITTDHAHPSWGAIYWQYYDDVKNVEAASVNELTLHRQLFVRRQANDSATYVPLNTTSIKPGDRVAVRLTITAGQDMQFVCLTDNRAACFEPVKQLSGYKYRERIGYYEEIKNTETRFYFESLPKGTYVITYELNVDRPGEYTQGLSTIQCLYAPQMIARASAQTVIVK